MRTVALISGGKDSSYNMMQCVAAGHDIVALANLKPKARDELDSYMYQSVGHQGIELFAEAMGLPLYRQWTKGIAQDKTRDYTPTENDEVEDLYQLLLKVKDDIDIEAVAVGAILSDYQRIRVENVCSRLGLVSLAYLWRRNQTELLQEMIVNGVEAIIIKVAALGLEPKKHLGLSLMSARQHLMLMKEKYGLNVCGEGGEYETFTLDCPLFRKRLVVDEKELVIHSDDPVAPVGYLNLTLHLEDKPNVKETLTLPPTVKNSYDFVSDLNDSSYSDASDVERSEGELDALDSEEAQSDSAATLVVTCDEDCEIKIISRSASIDVPTCRKRLRTESGDAITLSCSPPTNYEYCSERDDIPDHGRIAGNSSGWYYIGGVVGEGAESAVYMEDAMSKLCRLLTSQGLGLRDVCSVNLYVRDMEEYAQINSTYSRYLSFPNPPARVCVQCPLPPNIGVIIDAIAHKWVKSDEITELNQRTTMHVQGISHWAPANIGPYSQAVTVGQTVLTCGQVGLVPGAMRLVPGARRQSALALRHASRVLRAARTDMRGAVQSVCYVTHGSAVGEARRQLERRTAGAIAEYVRVCALPRGGCVEWHAWAHADNRRFHYEETGCSIGEYKVAICRRWNYDNTVGAFVCYVATDSSPSTCQLSFASEEAYTQHQSLASLMTQEEVTEVLEYCLGKLIGDAEEAPEPVAVNLRIFYKSGCAPAVSRLLHGAAALRARARVVLTAVPVRALHNATTFLSLSGSLLNES